MNGYFDGWQRFWQFSGRASREAFLAFFLVNMLSLTVRRLHDTNRSAWWLLAILVPVVGMVLWLILMVLPSEPQSNDNAYSQHDTTL